MSRRVPIPVRGAAIVVLAVASAPAWGASFAPVWGPTALSAQERPQATFPVVEAGPDISPRGAFFRALAFPGWGHSAIGAHSRGGFYFLAESATAYTLIRTRLRLNEVNARVSFRERFLRSELAAEGVTDADEVDTRLAEDATLQELLSLQDSRGDQQEDMVALGIFLLLLGGADAYVSAHLSRFPEPLEVEIGPVGGGRVELGVRLTLHE